MRREDQLFKTMSAVNGCVKECLRTDAPIATLERFVQSLRRNPHWNENEVAEVEAVAREALRAARRR